MKKVTVYEMDKLGLEVLEGKLQNLQNQKDILSCTYGESAKEMCEFKKVITDIDLLKRDIEMLNLRELRSNVKGHVTETSYDSESGFTIKIQSDNKIHIYEGIHTLDSAPSEQVDIGDHLGMIKEQLYYEVQDESSTDKYKLLRGAISAYPIVIHTGEVVLNKHDAAKLLKSAEEIPHKLNSPCNCCITENKDEIKEEIDIKSVPLQVLSKVNNNTHNGAIENILQSIKNLKPLGFDKLSKEKNELVRIEKLLESRIIDNMNNNNSRALVHSTSLLQKVKGMYYGL